MPEGEDRLSSEGEGCTSTASPSPLREGLGEEVVKATKNEGDLVSPQSQTKSTAVR